MDGRTLPRDKLWINWMDKLWMNPSFFSMCFLTCFSMFQHEHSSSIPALQVSVHGISGSSPAPDESRCAGCCCVQLCVPKSLSQHVLCSRCFYFPIFFPYFPLFGDENPMIIPWSLMFILVKTWIPWISDEFHLLYLLECWDVLEDPAISLKEIASLLGPRACSRWRKHQADWNWQTESNEWWRMVENGGE